MSEHLLADLADRLAQRTGCRRRVPVKNRNEILPLKQPFRLKAAALHQAVCDAGACRQMEGNLLVKLIIIRQKGTVNDAKDVLAMLLPVFPGKVRSRHLDLSGKSV